MMDDVANYNRERWNALARANAFEVIPAPREYRHTLSTVINGLVAHGFVIRHLSVIWGYTLMRRRNLGHGIISMLLRRPGWLCGRVIGLMQWEKKLTLERFARHCSSLEAG